MQQAEVFDISVSQYLGQTVYDKPDYRQKNMCLCPGHVDLSSHTDADQSAIEADDQNHPNTLRFDYVPAID